MKQCNRNSNRGITLIEMMIGVSVVAIMLTLAGTYMRNTGARAQVEASTAEVVLALRSARHAARFSKASIRIEIKLADDYSNYVITFAVADQQDGDNKLNLANIGLGLADIELPDSILISSDNMVFTFDSDGRVDTTGIITLMSTIDSDYESTVVVNDTAELVTISYSTPMEGVS
jgi:prepilin-type N-terminal cleavage/methylation domain-containing protein